MNYFKQYDWKNYNFSLISIVIVLSMIGAFTVKLADNARGNHYFKAQIFGLIFGIIVVTAVSVIDYHFICKFVIVYYLIGTGLVAATKYSFLGGTDLSTGTDRWLNLAGVNFQPSELVKIILILTLAVFYARVQKKVERFYILLLGGVIALLPVLFIVRQPDLSSSLVCIFIFAMIMYAAGTSYKFLLPIIIVGIPFFIVLVWYVQQPFQLLLTEYQQGRVITFLHPELDTEGKLMQQEASQLAIASGQLYGKYLDDGGSVIRNYLNVPVAESDFIWSVVGEEYGFLGSCLILVLYGIIISKCLLTARKAQDNLGMLIGVGISSMFAFQVFANVGVATFILPNTGLPLPFLSNGLSSMMSSMIAIGLIVNIGIQPAKPSSGGFTMRQNNRELDL